MIEGISKELRHWVGGVRLYIGIAIILITLETWWWASISYAGTQLYATRIEEVFAWLALGMVSTAISIGPIYKIFPKLWGRKIMSDARRLIGVGGGWFASLHIAIAYVSLFKLANPLTLPKTYQQSFLLGLVAIIILLAMVFTSFDKAFKKLGIWWFRLHRFVYLALMLALMHAFMIGTHATAWIPLIIMTVVAVCLITMHAYIAFIRSEKPTVWQIITISYSAVLLLAIFNYGYTQKLGYNPIEGKHQHQNL